MSEQPQADVIAEVQRDHQEVKKLFAQVEESRGDARQEACARLFRKLAMHETAEEIVVHPLVRRASGGEQVADLRLKEEEKAKRVVADMEGMDWQSAAFDTKLASLKADVLAHADSEEQQEHPKIRETIDAQRLRQLAAVYRAAEATAPTHAHPAGPSSATGNLLIGPIASIIDHTRDAVTSALKKLQS